MAFFTQAGFPFDERAHAFGKLADLGQVASLLHLVPDERELEPAIPRSQSEVNTATEPILFVDDDKNVLEGYKRLFLGEFRVSLASGGEKALAAIHLLGPFAMVISDMRMPGMNGAEFLCKVRELAPETVRMLLTGYKDVDRAIAAVNHGTDLPLSDQALRKGRNDGGASPGPDAISRQCGGGQAPPRGQRAQAFRHRSLEKPCRQFDNPCCIRLLRAFAWGFCNQRSAIIAL